MSHIFWCFGFLRLLLLYGSISSSVFATSSWDGTWKLDPERSQLTGETFSYSKTGNGRWVVRNGGPIEVAFALDGKPYRSFSDDETVTATENGPQHWTFSRQYKGQSWDVTHENLSADGKTITSSEVIQNPDGTNSHVTTILKRVGTGSGFEGTWESTQIIGRYQSGWVFANRFIFKSPHRGTMIWLMPDDQMEIEAKLDGSPVKLGGSAGKGNIVFRVTRISAVELKAAVWRDGKEERDYRMRLAPGGKTFTSSSWAAGKSNETRRAVYIRQ